MKKYALALDLIDDDKLIREYEEHHKNGWPEVSTSIIESGVLSMEIYRTSNRLFMVMETTDEFTFENKKIMDQSNKHVQEWEKLMWNFQQALPWSNPGEKWVLMNKIFELKNEQQTIENN
ncbi:L-rhamnose mutarotase [Pedobacter sp. MC2016-05]|uniref:L-rhamnose mutarotase n=1 Tax=Pedobacter sp. MC2016-05 TaxID=2994474 RepID=UPI002248668F|nr:L-rhamnose mutarotase [Pedobacter sp. MC2016-05]MCX2475376.1 L-rhamnose mutarotase [Pedobacter sp. MC2016-05]